MKLKLPISGALLAFAVAVFAACGGSAAPTPMQLTSEQLQNAYTAALASGDLARFSEILTDDFVFNQTPGPDGDTLTVNGRSAFMVRLADQIEHNTVMTITEQVDEGDKSTGKFSLTADNFRAIGIDALTGTFETTVRAGKIASLSTFPDDVSLQKLGAALAPPAPRELTVTVGAGQDTAVLLAYLPSEVTVRAGDTVTWNLVGDEGHTVTFLSGGERPADILPIPGGGPTDFVPNPERDSPTREPGAPIEVYSGTGYFNSGFMADFFDNTSFSLTFDTSGTYEYVCLLHRPHRGTVTVLPADARDVPSQANIDAQGRAESAELLPQLEALRAGLTATRSEAGPNGTTVWHVQTGGTTFDESGELHEFLAKEITIREGDSVVWSTMSSDIHTVTFHPGLPEPGFVVVEPQSSGPPLVKVNPQLLFPVKPGGEFDGTGLWNSGFMSTTEDPGGTAFTMTFTKTGVFDYVCVIHRAQGMVGTVTVVPR